MSASTLAVRRARALCRQIEPVLAEAMEKNGPSVEGLTFNAIEANSAAAGDAVARALMLKALEEQAGASEAEIANARRVALRKADPNLSAGLKPEDLRMTRQKAKKKRLKTIRGEIEFSRGYLHFPDLESGLFPPRQAPRDT